MFTYALGVEAGEKRQASRLLFPAAIEKCIPYSAQKYKICTLLVYWTIIETSHHTAGIAIEPLKPGAHSFFFTFLIA